MTIALHLRGRRYYDVIAKGLDLKAACLMLNTLASTGKNLGFEVKVTDVSMWLGHPRSVSPMHKEKALNVKVPELPATPVECLRFADNVSRRIQQASCDGVVIRAVLTWDEYAIPLETLVVRSLYVRKAMSTLGSSLLPTIIIEFPEMEIDGQVIYGFKDLIEVYEPARKLFYSAISKYLRHCQEHNISSVLYYIDVANGVEYVRAPPLSVPVYRKTFKELFRDFLLMFKRVWPEALQVGDAAEMLKKIKDALVHFREQFILSVIKDTMFLKTFANTLTSLFDVKVEYFRTPRKLSYETRDVVLYPKNPEVDPPAEETLRLALVTMRGLYKAACRIESESVTGFTYRTLYRVMKNIFDSVEVRI